MEILCYRYLTKLYLLLLLYCIAHAEEHLGTDSSSFNNLDIEKLSDDSVRFEDSQTDEVQNNTLSISEPDNVLKYDSLRNKQFTESEDVSGEKESLISGEDILDAASALPGSYDNISISLSLNATPNDTNTSSVPSSKKAFCVKINISESIGNVELLNASSLYSLLQSNPKVTNRSIEARCHLIYFFSPYCPFSALGSPYVNALARFVPNIPVYGIDSIEHHSVNGRYGIMGTPSFLLFHNGAVVGRYNQTEYSTSNLVSFISYYTNQEISFISVTSDDFQATLPSKVKHYPSYALWTAWIFLLGCCCWFFIKSELCGHLTEAFLNNWREAEAQHDHQD